MHSIIITLLAYLIDRRFGEFSFIKHPIIIIGSLITFFQKRFYKDSVSRGALLVLFMVLVVGSITFTLNSLLLLLPTPFYIVVVSIIASMFIAHKMLRDAVSDVLAANDKRASIAMLVSRDTKDMSESDVYKACIETYAENLSDGVIAPLFFLLFFGLEGLVLYKTINTLDSMVGYRTPKYEKYGKVSAIVDDILNFIPSRITALLIMLLFRQKKLFAFYKDGKKHDSPNAGHPITAMALSLGVKLGGDTSYFGKVKKKPFFGVGREEIREEDVRRALKI